VDAIPPVRGKPGQPRRRPEALYTDRAYDSEPHRATCVAAASVPTSRSAARPMGVGWADIVGLWSGQFRGSIGRGSSDCGRTGVETFTKH